MRVGQSALLGHLLVVAGVAAHGSHGAAWNTLNGRSFFEPSEATSNITTRSTTTCGPSYGNAVCDAGLCCSQDGKCGTGQYYCNAPSCLYQYGPACDANQVPPGTNTASVARPQFGSVPYGVTLTHCTVPGKVALTFDDGPWLYTNDLLDLLKQQNVKATFFIVGNNGGKGQIESDSTQWPTVMKRTFNEGHQIASHSWSHQDLSTLTDQQIRDQVIRNEIAFADVFGFIPTYIRPPYGRCYGSCLTVLQSLGYHVVNYDLDTLDWQENYDNSKSIFSSAIKASNPSKDSFIPLTHDIHYGTVHGFVQYMLDTLRAAGYTTALVGECMGDPQQNWYRDAKSGQQWSSSAATPSPTTTSTTSTSTTQAPTSSTTTAAIPTTKKVVVTTSSTTSTLQTSTIGTTSSSHSSSNSATSYFSSALGIYTTSVTAAAAATTTLASAVQRTSGAAASNSYDLTALSLSAALLALLGI